MPFVGVWGLPQHDRPGAKKLPGWVPSRAGAVAHVARPGVAPAVGFCVFNVNGKPLQITLEEGLGRMCCIPGRCPCWPREQPFDASEIRVLTCIQGLLCTMSGTHTWRTCVRNVMEACTRVDRRRLPYVLSTPVQLLRSHSQTLLKRVAYDKDLAKWVLNVGVCPNVGSYFHGAGDSYRGWQEGPLHPGRPPRLGLALVLEHAAYNEHNDICRLLAYGAYPSTTDQDRKSFQRGFPSALRQWHRWHARASRRLWIAKQGSHI
jgi:hypothetical protein